MRHLPADLRHAFRVLSKNPGFTLAATVTLALGIGAAIAIFGVVDAVLLRPLPYAAPERLARLGSLHPAKNPDGVGASYMDYLDWKQRNRSFERLSGLMTGSVVLGGAASAIPVRAAWVSAELFPALGVRPLSGRLFRADEDLPGGEPHVALLTKSLWSSRFAGNDSVLGTRIELDGASFLVVGVVPDDGPLLEDAGVVLPLLLQAYSNRSGRALDVVGRLSGDTTLEQARGDMDEIARALAREYPEADTGFSIAVQPLHDALFGDRRPALAMLSGAVALLLLIACANAANLLIAKSASRRHELAVRAALGASRSRLVAQLLCEAAVLAALACGAGLLAATGLLDAIRLLVGASVPRIAAAGVDARTALFAVGASAATVFLFGLIPALGASRRAFGSGLRKSERGGGESSRVANGLILVQTALCVVLLVGAALLGASYEKLVHTDVGLSAENVLTFRATLPMSRYQDTPLRNAFLARVIDRLQTLPGVAAAGITSEVPAQSSMTVSYSPEGHPRRTRAESPQAEIRPLSAGTLGALRIPVLAGRGIADSDDADSPAVIVVNRRLAARLWPGQDALGKHITLFSDGLERRVVGVVGDVRRLDRRAETADQMYVPFAQEHLYGGFEGVIRAGGDPSALTAGLEKTISELDPGVAVSEVRLLSQRLADDVAEPRFRSLLVGGFAAAALLLAAVGLYGVVAYAVTRRRFEIGVRIALGATPGDIRRHFVGRALALSGTGAALGLAAAIPATRVLSGLLFGVSAASPFAFVLAGGVLLAVAWVAADIPSRRASRLDLLAALRAE